MPFAFLLGVVAIAGGTLVTYFYDRDAPLMARLCAGACTGWAALGLVGFIVAALLGLTPLTLFITAVITAAPLAFLLRRPELRAAVRHDIDDTSRDVRRAILHPDARTTSVLVFYLLTALLLWLVFGRAVFERAGEIYT
ncbi:MAG: hypothetical protein ACRD68_11985, partial [Pyrinomonadaceae bacterium]